MAMINFAKLDKLEKLVKDTANEPQEITDSIIRKAGDRVLPHY